MPVSVYNRPAPQYPRMIVDAEGGALTPSLAPTLKRAHVTKIVLARRLAERFLPENILDDGVFKLWDLDWQLVIGLPTHVALALDSAGRVVALIQNLQ